MIGLVSSFMKDMEKRLGIKAVVSSQAPVFFFDNCPWDYEKIFGAVCNFWIENNCEVREEEVPLESEMVKTMLFSAIDAARNFKITLMHAGNGLYVSVI